MKWLFILTLLLNITFGVYNQYFNDDLSSTKIKTNHIDKGQIVLLNELDAAALKTLQDKVIPSNKKLEPTKAIVSEPSIGKTEELPAVNVVNKVPIQNTICYKIGPIKKDIMDDVRVVLDKEYNNQLSFGIETTSKITYYRIYIPPLESKDKIKEVLQKLDKNGLTDHYVMSIDGRKNAIALGVFKDKNAADKVSNKATRIGFSTIIEAISNDKNSLYELSIIFQTTQEITRFNEVISEKKLTSVKCDKKG